MADVVALQEVFSSTDAKREIWTVAAEVAEGTALIDSTDRPGVAYTASGAHTASKTFGPYTLSGIPDGGVGLDALQVSVATDGTWLFPVTGATSSTAQNTAVYAVVNTGAITGLTLTVGTNKFFGRVNLPAGHVADAAATPVKIGD